MYDRFNLSESSLTGESAATNNASQWSMQGMQARILNLKKEAHHRLTTCNNQSAI